MEARKCDDDDDGLSGTIFNKLVLLSRPLKAREGGVVRLAGIVRVAVTDVVVEEEEEDG